MRARPMRLRPAALGALLPLLLAGCATPYLRTDMPTPRAPGLRDALASLVGACPAPRPGAAPEAGAGASGEERRGRRCDAARDDADGGAPTPAGPAQKKP